jgi:hypothetical protein
MTESNTPSAEQMKQAEDNFRDAWTEIAQRYELPPLLAGTVCALKTLWLAECEGREMPPLVERLNKALAENDVPLTVTKRLH